MDQRSQAPAAAKATALCWASPMPWPQLKPDLVRKTDVETLETLETLEILEIVKFSQVLP